MTIDEFESYCDKLIKQEIQDRPEFKRSQDLRIEIRDWVNNSRIKLRKSFSKLSSQVDNADASLLEEIIDKKIKKFVERF
jgi:hypothetical protein